MFHKALLFRNYKQAKFAIWAFWLMTLFTSYKLFDHAQNLQSMLDYWKKSGKAGGFEYYFSPNLSNETLLQICICAAIAVLMIGFGRSNQGLEYSFSWPVRRIDLFLSNWWLGAAHITAAVAVSSGLNFFISHNTVLKVYLKDSVLMYYQIHELFTMIGVFTFSLFVGLIGASVVSQFAIGFIGLFVPGVVYQLLEDFADKHYWVFTGRHFVTNPYLYDFFGIISFPMRMIKITDYVMREMNQGTAVAHEVYTGYGSIYASLVVIAASLLLIVKTSGKSTNENNGKMLLYPQLIPYFKASVIVCAFLLGTTMFSNRYEDNPNLAGYIFSLYAGGILFTAIAWLIVRKLMGVRLVLGRK